MNTSAYDPNPDDPQSPADAGHEAAELLDTVATASLVGISLAHLHRLRRTGRFGPSPIHLGRAVRFRRRELIDWIDAGCPSYERWQSTKQDWKSS